MFKHDKYVRAWLDGETIEYQLFDGTWALHYGVCSDFTNDIPAFPIDYRFRIKRKSLEGWVAVYNYPAVCTSSVYEDRKICERFLLDCTTNGRVIRMREVEE